MSATIDKTIKLSTSIKEHWVSKSWRVQAIQESNNDRIDGILDIQPEKYNDSISLKKLCRSIQIPPDHECRRWLWLRALNITEDQIAINAYDNTVKQIYGKNLDADVPTPKFVDPNLVNMYYLNEKGKMAVKRVIRVLAFNKPYITYSPLLQPIASMCMHYHDEPYCYAILDQLTTKDTRNCEYLTRSVKEWCALCDVIFKLTKRQSRSIIKTLTKSNICKDNLFIEWADWIFVDLQFESVLSILDCFFVEGIKIIIRCAIGVTMFKYGSRPINLLRPKLTALMPGNKGGIASKQRRKSYNDSSNSINDIHEVLRVGLSIPYLRRSQLYEMLTKYEDDLLNTSSYDQYIAMLSLRDPANFSLGNVASHSSLVRISAFQDSLQNENVGPNFAPTNILTANADFETETLSRNQMVQIWSKLPSRIALCKPALIFSTSLHGRRLLTLIDRIEFCECFILSVRSSCHHLFGAYISFPDIYSWNNVRISLKSSNNQQPKFVGDGETFVFSFSESFQSYSWVGQRPNTRTDMFIKFDNSGIYIGGSGRNFALYIDSDLLCGSTGHSETFDNQPLIRSSSVDKNSAQFFKIAILEVFGFEYITDKIQNSRSTLKA
ncbi:hypothetical protein GJ496_002731 [Pomphorhynchus laevis]|nr:hypothetical protein GJ496_002731 [Pomphorhynchus laevis]